MKQVKITRATVAGGVPVEVGKVLLLEDAEARFLVAIGKAEEITTPAAGTAGGGGVDEGAALTTETAAPLVRRRGAKGV